MNPLRSFARAVRRVVGPFTPAKAATTVVTSRRTQFKPLTLEDRCVPAVYRTIDGTGNNLVNVEWGSTDEAFLRLVAAQYGDGVSTPAGETRPSARVISNAIADEGDVVDIDPRLLSAMMYAWGQFIDHDIDLTGTGTTEAFNVVVPTGDPYFDPNGTGTQVISLNRTPVAPGTGTSAANPRQQLNEITSWLDGSMVYGSDDATALSLRTMSGGKMKTSEGNLLPLDENGFFLAGDERVNENPELTSLQTLFVREHNRVAAKIAAANPSLTDEEIYQRARAWVIAEIQVITYKEWLPSLLGANAMPAYRGYDATANPAISNEFATAAFRLGHSMLGDDIEFLGNDGLPVRDDVSLAGAFFNPDLIKETGIDPILKYLSSDPSSKIDTQVVDSVRNFLFGAPGAGGLDLASLNIQRGRDHGLADYNTTRAALGLPKVTSFSQITSNADLAAKLKSLYGTVNNIDLWVGVLAENAAPGASVGPTAKAIIVEQFNRLRAADRFWYQRTFTGADLRQLESTTLSNLIRQNTSLTTVQQNAFVFRAEINGTVFGDGNRDGRQGPGESGMAGRTVNLMDAVTNEIVATTTTDARGNYRFGVADGLRTGRYLIQIATIAGETVTTPARPIAVTTGDAPAAKADVGVARGTPPRPTPPRPGPRAAAAFAPPVLFGANVNAGPFHGPGRVN